MKERIRDRVFRKFDGKCAYCGCELLKGWHVDHVKPVRRNREYDHVKKKWVYTGDMMHKENDVFENKVPACQSCNINKHSMDIEAFRKLVAGFVNSLNQKSTQYKVAKRYGMIQENVKPVVFYFETYTAHNNLNS